MKKFCQIVTLVLAVCMILAVPASAEEIIPYASNYFSAHSTYLTEVSNTSFKVTFSITAVGTMSELGVDHINIERSSDGVIWSVVRTYDKDDYGSFVASNAFYHSGSVTYSNKQSGYQYRAYVDYYAKKGSGSASYGVYAYFI